MRILFSAVAAYGHILPLAPLMEAAAESGHAVALVASESLRPLLTQEVAPEVEFLGAGATPWEFLAEAGRRTGGDPLQPSPEMIGEIFGSTRLDLDAGEALLRAREWGPDLVVAEAFDTVGPFVAAQLDVPWHQVGIGPGVAPVLSEQIALATARHYEKAGVKPVPASSYIDPCPPVLQAPDWVAPAPVLPVQVRAHRRPAGATFDPPRFTDPAKPTVLLTLGTVFSEEATLVSFGSAVADADVNVLATLGLALGDVPDTGGRGELRYVSFAPMEQLLDGVRLVVGAGGSGTILGALSRGVPLVLWPQGADQPINAARAAAAGVAIVVDSPADITGAVTRALRDDALCTRVAEVAELIAATPSPASVVERLVDDAHQRRRGDTGALRAVPAT